MKRKSYVNRRPLKDPLKVLKLLQPEDHRKKYIHQPNEIRVDTYDEDEDGTLMGPPKFYRVDPAAVVRLMLAKFVEPILSSLSNVADFVRNDCSEKSLNLVLTNAGEGYVRSLQKKIEETKEAA